MSSGLRSATIKCVIVPTASAFSETTMIKTLAAFVFALSLILYPENGYAEELSTQTPALQRHSLLNLSKRPRPPQSFIIKAACPSYSGCCCVIGGYALCMTTSECSALGGGCTGKC